MSQPLSVLVVEPDPHCPPDRVGLWLADGGAAVQVVRPYAGDPLPERVEQHALVVLGGHMGANDDAEHAWLAPTRRLLARSAAAGVPTLGICLGAQLLARACGGRVEVGEPGPEAGVVDVRWRPEAGDDPLLGELPEPFATSFPGPSMHHDAVVELPADAVWLGETAMYPHQAFRVGERAWGVQFHPEVSLPTFTAWGRLDADSLRRWGYDETAVVGELAARDGEVAAAGRALTRRFLDVATEAATPQRRSG
jgi:GMP synthase (glutamine-hydrolysing)